MIGIRAVVVTLALTLSFGLAGCTSSAAVTDEKEAAPRDFDGPWGSEFASAYSAADSDFERGVLSDGQVTAQEASESRGHIERCLADAGLTIDWDAFGGLELGAVDGDYSGDFFARSDPVLRNCEQRWEGSIRVLYERVRRNPDKQDEAGIAVRCLQAAGLVDSKYSERRWRTDSERDEWPFDQWSAEAQRCRVDPLGLWFDG